MLVILFKPNGCLRQNGIHIVKRIIDNVLIAPGKKPWKIAKFIVGT